ncbi:MAG: MFS transporter [Ilumatobacter sp.]|uniref:MFS transporter n=1 Tax=Ilumatobacter sp. TaxID=1967498 RepID=UPI00391DC6D2
MWALFLGLGLLMVGNGLNGAVIGVRSGNEGFDVIVTGVIMAGYFAGFLLAPSLVVRMIPSVGHIRVFAGLASTASSAVLVHSIAVEPISWALMRFVFGFCMAGLYIVIESWLTEMSDVSNRGRTLAVYMIVSMGSLGVGQYLIALADPNSFRLFVVSSVLVSMSLVPVVLVATTKAPVVELPDPISIRSLFGFVPTGVIASFMSGVGAGVVLGLGAVYATAIGLSVQRTALFLIAPSIGALLFQWPIGRLSDRVSRRLVILGVASAAAAICCALLVLPAQSPFAPLLMVGVGGTLYPLYSLIISFTLDWTPEGKIVGASGTLIRINGSGALAGPLITAPIMSQFGAKWFFGVLVVAFSTVVLYTLWRVLVKEAMPVERQGEFLPFPARATTMAIAIVRRPTPRSSKVFSGRPNVTGRDPHHPNRDPSSDEGTRSGR